MQELFMNMVMATALGNFINFCLVMIVMMLIGVFSIKYDSPYEIGVYSSIIGYLMILVVGIFGLLNGWVYVGVYVAASIVVAILQVSIFDVRQIQRLRSAEKNQKNQNNLIIIYRWITFKNFQDTKAEVDVDRAGLASYIFGYIGCAPFLVIRWVFHEMFKNLSEWISENISGMLKRKLERIFGIDEINERKAAATEEARKRNEQ